MSLIEDEGLDADLEDQIQQAPGFTQGRLGIAESLRGPFYSKHPAYWAGAVFAFLARLRYEGVNRPPGTDKPSVEEFYSSNSRIVLDVGNRLPKLAEKASAHFRYLQRTRKAKYNVRRAQFDDLWGMLALEELKDLMNGTARMAFDAGAANCRTFLRKEARDLRQFYASQATGSVPSAGTTATP